MTFDDILVKRNETLENIRKSSSRIKELTSSMFSPPKRSGRFGSVINNVDRILAVYDGVMFGVKIIGRVRKLIRRR